MRKPPDQAIDNHGPSGPDVPAGHQPGAAQGQGNAHFVEEDNPRRNKSMVGNHWIKDTNLRRAKLEMESQARKRRKNPPKYKEVKI